MKIPYAKPSITQLEIDFVNDAIANGWGEQRNSYIDRFEREFAEHLGVKYSIATSSCTGALHMGLSALGIGPGDEVILADSNWIATVAPVVHLGATPIFVDIKPDTWCIDPEQVTKAITSNTRAIIATHLYGNLCEMDELVAIGQQHEIPIIEDAAEAIGSTYKGRRAGSIGNFGVYSFHGSKTITTGGEGGIFVTNESELYETVLKLSNHGRSRTEKKAFWPEVVGFKFKMSNIQAAIGCAQLQRLDSLVDRKREILSEYRLYFDQLGVRFSAFNAEPMWAHIGAWMSTVVLDTPSVDSKLADLVLEELNTCGIDARPFFAPLSITPPFVDQNRQIQVNSWSNKIYRVAINLPSSSMLTNRDIKYIVEQIDKVQRKFG